jgi:HD superfamily phosphohydrolase
LFKDKNNYQRYKNIFYSDKVRSLKDRQRSLKLTKVDELCVCIAGLCHDLGHGPLGHLFEKVIERIDINEDWYCAATFLDLRFKMFIRLAPNFRQVCIEKAKAKFVMIKTGTRRY